MTLAYLMYFGVILIAFITPYVIQGIIVYYVVKRWGFKGLLILIAMTLLILGSLAAYILGSGYQSYEHTEDIIIIQQAPQHPPHEQRKVPPSKKEHRPIKPQDFIYI